MVAAFSEKTEKEVKRNSGNWFLRFKQSWKSLKVKAVC